MNDESEIKDHEARIASLKEEVRRYYALLSQMNDGFGIIDESNKFTFVNKRFATMLGYTEYEMLCQSLTNFMDDKNKKTVEEQIKTRTKGKSSQYELEWTSRNGVVVPTIISGAPLLDENGTHRGSFAVITDINELRQAQQSLQESEEMLSSIVDHTHTGICILDENYKMIYANDEMGRISGRTRKEMIGHDFRQFLTDKSKDEIIERYKRRQKGEEVPTKYDAFFLHKDGSERLIEVIATIVKDSSNQVKTIAQVLDVTEQRKSENALRESESRYRLVAENVKEIIFTMDMSFHFTFVTPSVEKLLGYTPEEMMKKSLAELMTPKSIGVTVDAFTKALAEEEKPEDEREHGQSLELELLDKNGNPIIFEISRTFLRDQENRPIGILGVARDIRARKEAEYALQESEERYRSLIEALPDAVVLTDLDGQILYVNKPAMIMF
ncbi:MAG: PAS domain S-box protein, partial [Candidatus Thorarchaeota archaeon]